MSALHFAVLMLRRGRPALRDRLSRWVVGNEVRDRRGDFAAIGACLRERRRDVVSYVARPALGGVESNDADRRRIANPTGGSPSWQPPERGRNTGVSMSGHLRSCFAACVLLAGLSTSPASSNPFDFLFNAAPAEATAPAPAEEECVPHPGKSTDGQRWVYRFDGHRKCWFQVADEVATVKKPVHHRAAKQRVAAPEESEAALHKRKGAVDARAELLRSAPTETPQQTPPERDFKVADAAAVPGTEVAALVPPVPVVAKPATDHPTPRPVDVEALLAAAPSASESVVASMPSTPAPVAITQVGDEERAWTVNWVGVLLMTFGFVCLLSSSATVRGPLIVNATFHVRSLRKLKQLFLRARPRGRITGGELPAPERTRSASVPWPRSSASTSQPDAVDLGVYAPPPQSRDSGPSNGSRRASRIRGGKPMANEVVVQWSTKDSIGARQISPRQESRKFDSRTAAVGFVMEELEKSRRHNVRMIVEGAEFSFLDIVRMYAACKRLRTFSSASSGRERNPIDSSSFPSATYSN